MADGYVVEAAGVTKRFRDSRGGALLTAVDCLDIRAARGKMTALIGPDGAGKTTFLRMVCGLMFPTEGNPFRTWHFCGGQTCRCAEASWIHAPEVWAL